MGLNEFIGWIGAISFILAYFLLVTGYLSSHKPTYHVLNVVGGVCLVINAIYLMDMPTLTVNMVWSVIALFAIVKIIKHRD